MGVGRCHKPRQGWLRNVPTTVFFQQQMVRVPKVESYYCRMSSLHHTFSSFVNRLSSSTSSSKKKAPGAVLSKDQQQSYKHEHWTVGDHA